MQFSLIGDDPDAMPFVRAIVESSDHSLVSAALTDAIAQPLLELSPSLRLVESWEDLLAEQGIEAAIVCGSSPTVLEGAKQLAAGRIPLLVVPHANQGAEFAYELLLIQDDTNVVLVPAFPLGLQHDVRLLMEDIATGRFGRVLFMKMERSIATANRVVTNARTDVELLHDADLLRRLGQAAAQVEEDTSADDSRIDVDQVTALLSGVTDSGYPTGTVTLAGARVPEATWVVNAVADEIPADAKSVSKQTSRWKLEVKGEQRSVVLSGTNRCDGLELESQPPIDAFSDSSSKSNADVDAKSAELRFLDNFADKVAERAGEPVPAWNDLIRVFEVIDARHRSVRRRRTIDLYYESTSERNQFKTQMTAIGCGVMTLTLFGLVAYLVIASIADLPNWVLHVARALWLAPLMVFIGLQLLYFITRPSSQNADDVSVDVTEESD